MSYGACLSSLLDVPAAGCFTSFSANSRWAVFRQDVNLASADGRQAAGNARSISSIAARASRPTLLVAEEEKLTVHARERGVRVRFQFRQPLVALECLVGPIGTPQIVDIAHQQKGLGAVGVAGEDLSQELLGRIELPPQKGVLGPIQRWHRGNHLPLLLPILGSRHHPSSLSGRVKQFFGRHEEHAFAASKPHAGAGGHHETGFAA